MEVCHADLGRAGLSQEQKAALTLTLEDLVRSVKALQRLSEQPMPARDAFKLSKIIAEVNRELVAFNQTRAKLCGTPEEQKKQYEELVATEVEIPGDKLIVERLPDLKISAGDTIALSWLFQE